MSQRGTCAVSASQPSLLPTSAGAAITVLGASAPNSESEVRTFAEGVTVEDCTLLTTGKFMWDYGFLWQITVWPEDYDDRHRRLAARYFPADPPARVFVNVPAWPGRFDVEIDCIATT